MKREGHPRAAVHGTASRVPSLVPFPTTRPPSPHCLGFFGGRISSEIQGYHPLSGRRGGINQVAAVPLRPSSLAFPGLLTVSACSPER